MSTLEKVKSIHVTSDDIKLFEYGIKLWKRKREIQALECNNI